VTPSQLPLPQLPQLLLLPQKPWDDVDDAGEPHALTAAHDLTAESAWKEGLLDPAGSFDWYKLSSATEASYIIHWQDSERCWTPELTADILVTVYKANGDIIIEKQTEGFWEEHTGETAASFGTDDGVKIVKGTHYSDGESVYIKVQGINSTTATGSYRMAIYK